MARHHMKWNLWGVSPCGVRSAWRTCVFSSSFFLFILNRVQRTMCPYPFRVLLPCALSSLVPSAGTHSFGPPTTTAKNDRCKVMNMIILLARVSVCVCALYAFVFVIILHSLARTVSL